VRSRVPRVYRCQRVRTARDAAANWLRMILFPTTAASVGVDLAKPRFREKVAAVRPRTQAQLQRLVAVPVPGASRLTGPVIARCAVAALVFLVSQRPFWLF
jgi:predicted fused transcriptional regulator/phosphomethylpyrimidine kinase